MAVYTEVTEADLAAFIASYDIGTLKTYAGITQGVENTNYRMETSQGRYILTLYEKRVNSADLPFFLGLMEHLAARGLNCPLPVHDRQGAVLKSLAGRPAAIVTWLEGKDATSGQTIAQCGALGAALAELHIDGADFKLMRKNALGLDGWRPLYNRFAEDADTIKPGLADTIARELDYLEKAWPADLPRGVIHADLFDDNAFFIGDRLTGIIDFYFACNDALAYDLAVCINAWAFDQKRAFVAAKSRALVSGYHAKRSLSAAEIAVLPTLARGAALRFLLTRAYDWINTPKGANVVRKDPLEYLAKLQFHQSVRDAHGYGLEV